jgi:hypothetical protein
MNRIILTIEAILFAIPITLVWLLGCLIVLEGIINQIVHLLGGKGFFITGNEGFFVIALISILGGIALFSLWRMYLYTMQGKKIKFTRYVLYTLLIGCGLAVFFSAGSKTLWSLPSILFCAHLFYVQRCNIKPI